MLRARLTVLIASMLSGVAAPTRAQSQASTIVFTGVSVVPMDREEVLANQTVIVDNKAGASGSIGAAYVANAAPDGLTIMMSATAEVVINQFICCSFLCLTFLSLQKYRT